MISVMGVMLLIHNIAKEKILQRVSCGVIYICCKNTFGGNARQTKTVPLRFTQQDCFFAVCYHIEALMD